MHRLAKLMVPLAALAITPAHSAPATVKAGIEAWQKGDFAGAVAIWRPLAEAGNADAAFDLAQAYRLGRGVPTDLSAAQTWLTRAAKKGHLDAQVTLGVLLFDNGDQKGAIPWLKAAAEKGEPRAELIYGTALFNGDGVPRDPVLGYAFVARSAAQGLSAAKGTLQDLDSVLPPEQRKRGAALAGIVAKPKTIPVLREATKTPAPSKAVPVATPVRSVAQGGWRIQLGAFSKRSSAEALFKRWSSALGGKLPVYSSAGAITRVQVGPYPSKAAAAAACASLAKRGQACFPVAAK